jgi:glycerophosphoryl diester phosphodiesterase
MVKMRRRRRRVKGFIRRWGQGTRPPVMRIAHRGASGEGLAPENTLAAIEKAMEIGVDLVEVDIQVTADGHPVLVHDRRVDRTTNGRGLVDTLTLDQVRRLDAGNGFSDRFRGEKVPTLQEAIDLVRKRAVLLIETKTEESAERAVSVIRSMRAQSYVMIQSFLAPALRAVSSLDRRIPTSFLMTGGEAVMRRPTGAVKRIHKVGANAISLHYRAARPAMIEAFLARAMGFWVWTVDEEDDMRVRSIDHRPLPIG